MRNLLLVLTCFLSALKLEAQNELYTTPYMPLSQPLSGHYAGIVNNELWIYGGCNFPREACADGGKKKYYPQAYGASVCTPQGAVLMGGTEGVNVFAQSVLYKNIDHRDYKTAYSQYDHTGRVVLPDMPVGLKNLTACTDGDYIYAMAGETDSLGPNRKVFRLAWPDGKAWKTIAEMPDMARVQAVSVVQNDATGPCIYIFGGMEPATKEHPAFVHNDALKLNLRTGEWTRLAWEGLPSQQQELPTVGAVAGAQGFSTIFFLGGVNRDIYTQAVNQTPLDSSYLRHPVEWYRFQQDVLVYNTFTDSWTTLPGDPNLARAGATLSPQRNYWYLAGGETMPGVRTADVTVVQILHERSFGWLNWAVLVLYLLSMLALGFFFMRREKGAEDFFRGGGRIPWWAAGISIYATMLSAITYMAIPAKSFATDWTYYPMLITILLVSFPVIRYYLPYFRRLKVASAYEYLEQRFNLATRLIASGLFIIFMIVRMALVLYLPSLALSAVTGISIDLCILLMGLVTIVYCTMGGVEAVIWGDVIQGIILVGGAIFSVAYLVLNTEGGVMGTIDIAMANDKLRLFDWSLDYRTATFWVVIVGGMANNLISYTSDQTVIQRYMTTKDERSAGRSILMNGLMSVFVSIAFYAIGTGLYTFFKTHPADFDFTMSKADAIFPYFMMSQMPAGIAGLLIAAIFAATMSTISSNINSVSTAFCVDFIQRFRPSVKDRSLLRTARVACLVSGIIGVGIALLMASLSILSLFDYFNMVLGLLTSGLGGLFLIGVFFPRIGGRAALIGFLAGIAAVFAVNFCTQVNFLLFGAIGMASSVAVAYILSKFNVK